MPLLFIEAIITETITTENHYFILALKYLLLFDKAVSLLTKATLEVSKCQLVSVGNGWLKGRLLFTFAVTFAGNHSAQASCPFQRSPLFRPFLSNVMQKCN